MIHRAVRGGRRAIALSFVYGYSHLLVYAGVTAASVGIEAAIEGAGEGLSPGARAVRGGGLAAVLVGTCLVHGAAPAGLPGRLLTARLGAAAGALGVALGPPLGGGATVGLLALALAALVAARAPYDGSDAATP